MKETALVKLLISWGFSISSEREKTIELVKGDFKFRYNAVSSKYDTFFLILQNDLFGVITESWMHWDEYNRCSEEIERAYQYLQDIKSVQQKYLVVGKEEITPFGQVFTV